MFSSPSESAIAYVPATEVTVLIKSHLSIAQELQGYLLALSLLQQ